MNVRAGVYGGHGRVVNCVFSYGCIAPILLNRGALALSMPIDGCF